MNKEENALFTLRLCQRMHSVATELKAKAEAIPDDSTIEDLEMRVVYMKCATAIVRNANETMRAEIQTLKEDNGDE